MVTNILTAVGGLGLFLLGMILLTDGLRGLAGRSLRRLIAVYTRTPVSGAVTGAVATAVVQSSSAITVTAIGFVGAGLLTFTQALGVIFGANIGTTITGWIVALLGFKFDLALMAWPALLVGVLARAFGRGRAIHMGLAVAGLSLLLIGIEVMQGALASFEGIVTPEVFPEDTLFGRFQLLLIGALITIVTQSSSAGVATVMVALGSGVISLPQGAAMVIGMDVGTTVTAALATIGGSTAMRQTGFAHVIYNMMTGVMAFFLLGPYAAVVGPWVESGAAGSAQFAVVGFHTFFNTLGVILVLPFTGLFARFILKLIPASGPSLTQRLDRGLLSDAEAALAAAVQTTADIRSSLYGLLVAFLNENLASSHASTRLKKIDDAIEAALEFLSDVKPDGTNEPATLRFASVLHALDHLSRLTHRAGQVQRIDVLASDHRLMRLKTLMQNSLAQALEVQTLTDKTRLERTDRLRQLMRRQRLLIRQRTVRGAVASDRDWQDIVLQLDGARWLHRVSYHVWRIEHHLRLLKQERV